MTGFSFPQELRANLQPNRCIANEGVGGSIVDVGFWVPLTSERMCQVPIWGGRGSYRSRSFDFGDGEILRQITRELDIRIPKLLRTT